jgi:hypothetical protein
MLAAPAATTPPMGSAWALAAKAIATTKLSFCKAKRTPVPVAVLPTETFLPWLVAFSGTATNVPVVSFQSER